MANLTQIISSLISSSEIFEYIYNQYIYNQYNYNQIIGWWWDMWVFVYLYIA